MAERILPLQYLKGVGPRRAEALAKENIVTPLDLVLHVPRAYIDRSVVPSISFLHQRCSADNLWSANPQPTIGVSAEVSIIVTATMVQKRVVGKGRSMMDVVVTDGSRENLHLLFWNQLSYFEKLLQEGQTYLVSGTLEFDAKWNRLSMHHPDVERIDEEDVADTARGVILPKYPLTQQLRNAGISMKVLRSLVDQALPQVLAEIEEPLPGFILQEYNFPNKAGALTMMHQPTSMPDVERARSRMKYEEIFFFELMMATRHRSRKRPENGIRLEVKSPRARRVVEALPYELTRAQRRVIREIMDDVSTGAPMNRLLQGDVGSGKTIVALLVLLNAVDNGYQTVLMAPTEILAEQHFHSISALVDGLDVGVALVSGNLKGKLRKATMERIASGEVKIVIGTHALFEADVPYNHLGLVVIDEQHRFGVAQRAEVRRLGKLSHPEGPRTPHMLVMSATPIPRTLSMTLYGDLDVSILDELPKGRRPIETTIAFESTLPSVFAKVRAEVQAGRQAYIVYPLVEKSEKIEAKSATEHFEMLRDNVFPDLRVALLHGQMQWDAKEEVMHAFLRKEFDVLVSTTVIEVGVDVPNATVMVIENAERFGLSQLHQLRGRVGRGGERSYCFLVTKDHFRYQVSRGTTAEDRARSVVRLKTMAETTDGFRIAEVDLRLRGPGDVLGVRQSGLPDFRFVDLVGDTELIARARQDAFSLIERDPHLRSVECAATKEHLLQQFNETGFQTVA